MAAISSNKTMWYYDQDKVLIQLGRWNKHSEKKKN